MNKEESEALITSLDATELLYEIKPDGLGYIFYESFKNGGTIYTDELIKWVHSETKGANII